MDKRTREAVEAAFGRAVATERIRTHVLFARPYGGVTVPDVKLGGGLGLYVARVPDGKFLEGRCWSGFGTKPSDGDPDLFVVPAAVGPGAEGRLRGWAQVCAGRFVTTCSGVVVLDVLDLFGWEGCPLPGKRDYGFDRHRLGKSAAALKALAGRA